MLAASSRPRAASKLALASAVRAISSNRPRASRTSHGSLNAFDLQHLEDRKLFAGGPLGVKVIDNVLAITGTAKDDQIIVVQSGSRFVVQNGSWRKQYTGHFDGIQVSAKNGNDQVIVRSADDLPVTLSGGNGNDLLVGADGDDQLIGGAGNDRLVGMGGNDWEWGDAGNDVIDGSNGDDNLYGGAGNDRLSGGNGDDVIVSIGGGDRDSVQGGNGFDSFWADDSYNERILDASSDELDNHAVHRVASFEPEFGYSVSKELNGQDLLDPDLISGDGTVYQDFGSHYLFSADGPTLDDVNQGALGDCYFLAQVGSFAQVNPNIIRQSVVDLGDGTFAVQFVDDYGAPTFYRVDGELPVNDSGELAYAGFGADDSVWVGIMEKAWCFAHNDGDNASLDQGGFSIDVAKAMGHDGLDVDTNDVTVGTMMDSIETAIGNGMSVTAGTYGDLPENGVLVAGHAYTVVGVERGDDGATYLVVRNPWGIDNDPNTRDGNQDGYVYLTTSEAWGLFRHFAIADAS